MCAASLSGHRKNGALPCPTALEGDRNRGTTRCSAAILASTRSSTAFRRHRSLLQVADPLSKALSGKPSTSGVMRTGRGRGSGEGGGKSCHGLSLISFRLGSPHGAVDRFKNNAFDLVVDGESYRSRLKPDIDKLPPPPSAPVKSYERARESAIVRKQAAFAAPSVTSISERYTARLEPTTPKSITRCHSQHTQRAAR
jgi:hypothetical protein